MDINALQEMFRLHLENVAKFQFTVDNPVFWVGLLVLALVLIRFWDVKKSFSFSISIGVILLAATKIESYMTTTMSNAGEAFDPIAVRLLTGVVICLIMLYYIFIKADSSF